MGRFCKVVLICLHHQLPRQHRLHNMIHPQMQSHVQNAQPVHWKTLDEFLHLSLSGSSLTMLLPQTPHLPHGPLENHLQVVSAHGVIHPERLSAGLSVAHLQQLVSRASVPVVEAEPNECSLPVLRNRSASLHEDVERLVEAPRLDGKCNAGLSNLIRAVEQIHDLLSVQNNRRSVQQVLHRHLVPTVTCEVQGVVPVQVMHCHLLEELLCGKSFPV
mmetsp:Transcript_38184/g.109051  ORF Transcript_38184/g.109051 Transcript_38184/m.109051 type:complete len:217 (-) Transcript_38184:156-806(-)